MKELVNLHDEIIDIYGYMVQVSAAIGQWNKLLRSQIASRRTTPRNTMFFGKDNPNVSDARYQYKRTFRDLATASAKNGTTSVIHRRSVVVVLVASWEDRFRKRIADECGIAKDDVTSDFFHDLNRYRQAILHASGKLREDAKLLRFFRRGDRVVLTDDQMDSIFRMLIDELNRIGTKFYDSNPGFNFDKRLG